MSLNNIRKKNSKKSLLMNEKDNNINYSEELIKQCREEFETSIKPMRDYALKKLIEKVDVDKLIRIAKENTKYNEQGYAVISEDDEWREDNEWNRDYDEKHEIGNVTKALENGFKEIKEHKQGKREIKSLKVCEKMWEKWIEEEGKNI